MHRTAGERPGEGDRAVDARIGGDGDDHATTTSTPLLGQLLAIGGADLGVGDQGVDTGDRGEADEVLAADLRRISGYHNIIGGLDHGPLDGGLVAVRGGQAVADADRVGADERDVHPQGVEHAQCLLADRRLGETADTAAEQLQGHRWHGSQPGGDRHRVGHHDQLAVGGQLGRDARGGGPRVQQHAGPAEGKELGGGRGDGVLVFGAGGLALTDAGLDEVQRTDRHGAAVHPSQDARLVQDGEVAAHRLGGDVVGLRQFGHRGTALEITSEAIAC